MPDPALSLSSAASVFRDVVILNWGKERARSSVATSRAAPQGCSGTGKLSTVKTIQKNERSAQGGLRRTLLISHNQHNNHIRPSFHYAHFYLGPACIALEYGTMHDEAGKGPTLSISAPHFNRYSFIHGCRIQGAPDSCIVRVLGYSGELINMSCTSLHSSTSTVSNPQESGRKQSIQKPAYLSTPRPPRPIPPQSDLQ